MTTITLNFPTDEEEELIRRFTVNKNYLQALSGFLRRTYGKGDLLYDGLKKTVDAHPPYARIARATNPLDDVRRYLLLGWTSEIQLHLPELMGFDAMVSYANAWAPVHAYYAVYGGLQAWFAADGQSGNAGDHTAALSVVANQIRQRDLFPEPWNLLAIGCPMRGEKFHVNAGAGIDCISHVEVLSIPQPLGVDNTFWPRYGLWLRTTREARLVAREEKWKQQHGKQRISPAERSRIATAVSPTSIFDCFFRLRIKSNYGAIDPYLVKHIGQADHVLFNQALCTVTRATLGLIELYVLRRIGRVEYAKLARDFVAQDKAGLSQQTLAARLAAFGV